MRTIPVLRLKAETEVERRRSGEQERELDRLRRILKETSGNHQEKDEVINGRKLG